MKGKARKNHTPHQATIPFAALLLLESMQHDGFISAHEDLPELPAKLLR